MDIKHNIERFKNLTGCSIIEGHLIISGFKDDQALTNLSFPELREVTEYVIFYQAQNIVKLNHLFPNLSVIRGNKLVAVRSFLMKSGIFRYFLALFEKKMLLLVQKNSESQKIIFVEIWYLWRILVAFWHFSTFFGYFW